MTWSGAVLYPKSVHGIIVDMVFADKLKELHDPPRSCKVASLIKELPDGEQDAAHDLFRLDSGYSGAKLAVALAETTGTPVSASAVNNHRKGECPCRSRKP